MKSGLSTYKHFGIFLIIIISKSGFANNTKDIINTDIQLDFRTMHIWRGIATSYTPTFEPTFEVTKNNYTTGLWFAQSIDGNYTELDLYLTYKNRNFIFSIYDYFCPTSIETSNEIANYGRNSTKHTIELDLTYLGTEQLPIQVLVATMVYGDDLNPETNENFYSTYIELKYNMIIEMNSIELFLGINPFQSYYNDKFGILNAGITASRNLKIKNSLEIPIQASLITNPLANSVFLNFGFTL